MTRITIIDSFVNKFENKNIFKIQFQHHLSVAKTELLFPNGF